MDTGNPDQSLITTAEPSDVPGRFWLFSPSGRLGRTQFIGLSLWAFLVLTASVAFFIRNRDQLDIAITGLELYAPLLGLFVLVVAAALQRCHDLALSGWRSLLLIVPIVGVLVWLHLAIVAGTPGHNRFGRRPRKNWLGAALAGLAIPACLIGTLTLLPSGPIYIDRTTAATLNSHYEEGARFVANEMREYKRARALGRRDAALPADGTAWIGALNSADAKSPDGTNAYVPAGGETADNGAVGLAVTGSAATGNLSVELRRPAFVDLEAAASTIRLNEI